MFNTYNKKNEKIIFNLDYKSQIFLLQEKNVDLRVNLHIKNILNKIDKLLDTKIPIKFPVKFNNFYFSSEKITVEYNIIDYINLIDTKKIHTSPFLYEKHIYGLKKENHNSISIKILDCYLKNDVISILKNYICQIIFLFSLDRPEKIIKKIFIYFDKIYLLINFIMNLIDKNNIKHFRLLNLCEEIKFNIDNFNFFCNYLPNTNKSFDLFDTKNNFNFNLDFFHLIIEGFSSFFKDNLIRKYILNIEKENENFQKFLKKYLEKKFCLYIILCISKKNKAILSSNLESELNILEKVCTNKCLSGFFILITFLIEKNIKINNDILYKILDETDNIYCLNIILEYLIFNKIETKKDSNFIYLFIKKLYIIKKELKNKLLSNDYFFTNKFSIDEKKINNTINSCISKLLKCFNIDLNEYFYPIHILDDDQIKLHKRTLFQEMIFRKKFDIADIMLHKINNLNYQCKELFIFLYKLESNEINNFDYIQNNSTDENLIINLLNLQNYRNCIWSKNFYKIDENKSKFLDQINYLVSKNI